MIEGISDSAWNRVNKTHRKGCGCLFSHSATTSASSQHSLCVGQDGPRHNSEGSQRWANWWASPTETIVQQMQEAAKARVCLTPFLLTLTSTHLLLGCSRLCRYMKFTNNLLMSLHLEREESRGHAEWLYSPCGSTVVTAKCPPPHRPHLPLFARGELPGLRLLQLMVHFGCLVI